MGKNKETIYDNPNDLMLKIDHVFKRYRLGSIGGGTLSADLQSWWAKVRHKPDPNLRIGETKGDKHAIFYALKDVSFEVKKGEALGIIGSNGAGKSTLLKLICQVTAPTEGKIFLNGRVTSMLEVGTGFHGELTGRENIYINGAILGMSKKEIDSKIEDIIEFSECRQFIDTPVKRYSSGMYVKLAFSVAAHLDSEIVIMDEVLAVGDINFQQKCIAKMREIAHSEGRTVLYVSHNMATVKALCDRCLVLNKGQLIYDGDVDEAIAIYSNKARENIQKLNDYSQRKRSPELDLMIRIDSCEVLNVENGTLSYKINLTSQNDYEHVVLRCVILDKFGTVICTSYSDPIDDVLKGTTSVILTTDVSSLADDIYKMDFNLSHYDGVTLYKHDGLYPAFYFEIGDNCIDEYGVHWLSSNWGKIKIPSTTVKKVNDD